MTTAEIDPGGGFSVALQDGATLRAWSQGEGRALLLVSGLGGTGGFWKAAAADLGRRYRVLRFDQRGIGASTRGTAPCTIDQLAHDCLAVLDAAGVERCVVLGHSTGGCIAQALGRIAPQRFDGLILSATWLGPNRYMSELFGARRDILAVVPEAYATTSALMAYPPAWLAANWHVLDAARASAPTSPEARRIVRERIDALLAFDGSAAAASLAPPLMILGARDDLIVPAFLQEELAAALPAAQLTFLDEGGHFFPISRRDAFTASVDAWVGAL